MNIGEHFKKDYWTRRIPLNSAIKQEVGGSDYIASTKGGPNFRVLNLTQDDFLSELEPTAHEVNSEYMSTRPVYKPSDQKDSNGEPIFVIDHYDEVETVALGIQKCITMKKVSHYTADGFWIAREGGKQECYEKIQSWKDRMGLNAAWTELVDSVFSTGDGAIYLYNDGKNVEYQVFSYLKGDTLYPDIDEKGREVVYRRYKLKGVEMCDIFTPEKIQTWMHDQDDKPKNIMERLKSAINVTLGTKSEDGYTLIRETKSQTGDMQLFYFRVPDIPTGPAQLSIQALENALSYVSEEAKSSAFPILFLKAEKIVNLPPSDINGKTIGIKGDSESLAHSDGKFLAPPDASNISKTQIDSLWNNIVRTTMSVFIEPEIFRTGLDSSAALKLLFTPEIQWAQNMWPYFNKGVRRMTEALKTLVGLVEGNVTDYADLMLSTGQNIWIPQNTKEQVDIETSQVYARLKSRKAAMADLGNSHLDDYEQIWKEWEEEVKMKAEIPAQVKQEYGDSGTVVDETNPDAPKIDKNDKGRTIVEN